MLDTIPVIGELTPPKIFFSSHYFSSISFLLTRGSSIIDVDGDPFVCSPLRQVGPPSDTSPSRAAATRTHASSFQIHHPVVAER